VLLHRTSIINSIYVLHLYKVENVVLLYKVEK